MRWRYRRDRGRAVAEHGDVGERLAIDDLDESLAHARVVERLERVIEDDAFPATARDLLDARYLAVLELIDLLGR